MAKAVVIVWAVVIGWLLAVCIGLLAIAIILRGAWLSRHDAHRDDAEHGADDPFLHVDFHDEDDPHE